MDIRSPLPPDDGSRDEPALPPPSEPSAAPAPAPDPVDAASFRVPTVVIVAKFAVAGLLALVAGFAPQSSQVIVGLTAALAVLAYAGRDVIARERLRADAAGIVAVRGYAGHRPLSWNEIEGLRVDSRARLGARTATLEVDAGEELFFFTRNDLGVEPDEALALLEQVRAG